MRNLVELIILFEEYVALSFKIFTEHYGITTSPIVAVTKKQLPRNGEIVYNKINFKFIFHGMGCRCCFNDIIVDFNYTYKYFNYKGFEIYKLHQFVKSLSEENIYKNEEIFQRSITDLVKEGILLKNTNPIEVNTYDFYLKKN